MAVDKSRTPYFDDYKKEKGFHEILFVPSNAVQIRELNQIQTMFYEQVSRFADHVFEDGSIVIPGETSFDLDLSYITADVDNYDNLSGLLGSNEVSIESSNGLKATVKIFSAPEGNDPTTFYLQYLSSSDDGETNKCTQGEQVTIYNNGALLGTATVTDVGTASKFTVAPGVYYINGRFVMVEGQTVLLDKYSKLPSKVVCLQYNESIVTENQDPSLFDNAQGTTNFTAPGAHRLKVNTSLKVYDLSELDDLPENAIEIFRIDEGVVQRNVNQPQYAVFNDVLAQRTYEESGDYTTKAFNIGFEADDDPDKFVIGVESGIAYVKGYRVENLSTKELVVDRARDTGNINNSSISASLGYYIEVENMNIIPDLATLQEIKFYDSVIETPGVEPSGNVLGSARVRFVRQDGSTYRLYLFDAQNASKERKTGFIANAMSVHSSIGTAFSADLTSSELIDPSNNSLVYPLNVDYVKTLRDEFGASDTSFSSVKQFTTSTDSNGKVTISASNNEVFVNQDPTYAFASFTDTNEFIDVAGNFTLSGNPNGSVITFDFGIGNAGRTIRINAQVAKEQVSQKTKTTQSSSVTGSLDGDGKLGLNKADVFSITSVIDDNDNDVTKQFTLVENKTQSFYGVSYVTGPTGVSYPVTVTFDYFQHSSGDYFGPDSYVDVNYENIPTENGVRLSDVLDFRPRIADDGDGFSGAGTVVGNVPTPFTIVRCDVEHYMPRIDKIYVDSNGEFGVVKGVPSLNPNQPENPSDAMVLYLLDVPAYTFSPSDVQAKKINNRRYTMKDIGHLEDRLANVEYYVTLNFLEQETEAKQVIDPGTGLNRFKNGFLTDSFVDHSTGDFAWDSYHVSMAADGEMRPEFSLNAVDLIENTQESSNISVKNGIVTLPYTEKTYLKQNLRSTTINVNPYAVYRWNGETILSPSVDSWIDTQYTNPDVTYRVFNNGRLTQTWNSWQLNWSGGRRTTSTTTGNRIETTTTTTTSTNIDVIGDRVVDTSVIPFMRSINVGVEGIGHRPGTRLHFFFDGKKVNGYVRPAGGSFGDPVKANGDGHFDAVYRIPNNDAIKFRTGQKQLIVTDEPDNSREDSTSYSETTFTSTGVRNTRQRRIIATRSVNTSTRTRFIPRVRSGGDSDGAGGGGGADPLAQSFLVERDGGVFVTKIDAFFSTKDDNVPVKVEVREMENGVPTLRVVPGGIKTLLPSEVSVSEDGSVPTSFEFSYPIHLLNGLEYCFVIMSNSNEYNAHIATMGERDKGTGKYIVEQPYTGVMFKSQNNTTWTEDQMSDLQFHIHCAEFDTNVVGELVLNNAEFDKIRMDVNPFTTVSGSSEVIVNSFQHNYAETTMVVLSGAIGGNGLADEDLNGTWSVKEVLNPNQFVIDVGVNATASGEIGGDTVEISNTVQASLLNPNIADIEFANTSIEYTATGTIGKSIDGTEGLYQTIGKYTSITNKEANPLEQPWIITNESDEQANTSGNKSMTVRALLRSTNPNISPVVDLQGASVITPFALITKPVTDEQDGSNNWANYRTRVSGLKNPANSIRAFMDINKPQGSDVIVSARFGNSDEEIQEASWVNVTPIVEQTSGNGEGFLENEYALEDLDDYTLYQVMVQLKSDSATRFPICKRFRVLALGT